jgi:hypothetical protein
MPLTEKEVNYQNVVDRVFNKAPLYRRIGLFLFCDLLPLAYDRPASLGNVKILKLSNWYRFNKAEGHYFGMEYQFLNNALLSLYATGGYSLTQKSAYYNLKSRYRGFEFQIGKSIKNLGGFDYNRTSLTLAALFSHRDDLHYYHSRQYNASQTMDIFQNIHAKLGVYFEEQNPVTHITHFSLFNKDRMVVPNYGIKNYNNHRVGIELNYLGNRDFFNNRPILYHGNPFLNISIGYYVQNASILKATENRSIYHVSIRRFQPILTPMAVDFKCIWHKQDKSDFLQEFNLISRVNTIFESENDLGFYSLNDYDFIVKDYLKLQGDATLFNFPKLVTLRMSFGGLVSYTKPYGTEDMPSDRFKQLVKAFWEYGIVIKGISIINFYVISNNLDKKHYHFLFRMTF